MSGSHAPASRLSCIVYDARSVIPGMTGVGRCALNLLHALAARPDRPPLRAVFSAAALARARRDPALAGVDLVSAPDPRAHPRGELWLRFGARRLVPPGGAWFGPAFIIPGGAQPFRRTVLIHDLFVFTHPHYYPAKFALWLRWATARACRFADTVIVPSAAVAGELARRRLAPLEKIHVVHEAPDRTGAPWEDSAAPALVDLPETAAPELGAPHVPQSAGAPLILSIGTLDPRKDPETARRACVRLAELLGPSAVPPAGEARDAAADGQPLRPFEWLWLGGPGPVRDATPAEWVERAAWAGFRTPGATPGPAVRACLRRACVLVSCSHTEGFNIPLVEAMAAGVPIVASDLPVHREVAGDCACYFPPGDSEALARTLERLLNDGALREQLARRGLARAPRFSWNRAAAIVFQLLSNPPD